MRIYLALFLLGACAVAQQTPSSPSQTPAPALETRTTAKPENVMTVPAGTRVPIVLKQSLSTKNARQGDPVYAETNFPVVVNGKIVIPAGTYVQGTVERTQRPGRVKGKGEMLIHFNTLIFPTGYTLLLPGAVDNVPGADSSKVKDQEGTIQQGGTKAKDAGTIATTAASGAALGGIATQSGRGIAYGGLAGAGAGLATALLTRGPDLKLESGTSLEMILERPISVEHQRVGRDPVDREQVQHEQLQRN